MQKTILIRYGEIFLKGNNRSFFESRLIGNIKHALKEFEYDFNKSQGRYLIENYDPDAEGDIIDCLTKVFGVHSVSPSAKIKTNFDAMSKIAADFYKEKGGSFRVTVRRADKTIKRTSMSIAALIGEYILENCDGAVVDLYNFDTEICVDIRENGYTYVFVDKIPCADGMPVGCSGKGLLLLSGGIDSPVAGYMMSKRGLSLEGLHFHSMPYTSEMAKEKVVKLAKIISAYTGNIKLHIVPFTRIQEEIHAKCPSEFMITIMRRIMMRIAERLSKTNGCGCIITGESLGQVASQTMQSITVTNSIVEEQPVFRPLIGMDKSEIIDVSKKLGAFETSILPYQDCCTIFLPKNPAIRPKLETVLKAEAALNIEELIEDALNREEILDI